MLEIKGKEYEPKFNYAFANRLYDDYSQDNVDGFDRLIGQLVDQDPDGLVNGYRYALDVPVKDLPSKDAVAEALDQAGIFNQGKQAFSNMFKKIKSNGFLAMKLAHLMHLRDNEVNTAKKVLPKIANKKDQKQTKETLAVAQVGLDEVKKALKDLEK